MAQTTTRKQIREAAMDDIGLFIPAVVDSIDTDLKQITVSKLADAAPNIEWLANAFVTADGNTYRRITKMVDDTVVQLTDNVPNLVGALGIYFLLTPEECNLLLDRELTSELYSNTRTEIPLVAADNEYALPASIHTTADITGLVFRDVSNGNLVWESEVGSVRWIETGNALTAHLPNLPVLVSNVSLVVFHKERYAALATDAATTTCPYDLAWRALEVGCLNKLDTKYGPTMRQKFVTAWARSDRALSRLKHKHMPPLTTRDFTYDNEFNLDIPGEILDGSW